jgi:serine/threonine protein kinase
MSPEEYSRNLTPTTALTPLPEYNPDTETIAFRQQLYQTLVDHGFDSIQSLDLPEEKRPSKILGFTGDKAELLDSLSWVARQKHFEVLSLLGIGGMGAVAKAKDLALNRMVALKFVRHNGDPTLFESIQREAEQIGRLPHDHIVQIHSMHTVGSITFYVMELVDGEDLHDRVLREPALSISHTMHIILEALKGIRAAHEGGLIHRDIKPRNILLSREGRVKVADFGIASTQDECQFKPTSIAGTIGFMAPEQARGEAMTADVDLFSLTATLYFALTKQLPVPYSKRLPFMLAQNQYGDFTPINNYRPDLPPPLVDFIMRNIDPEPSRRERDSSRYQQELKQLYKQACEVWDKPAPKIAPPEPEKNVPTASGVPIAWVAALMSASALLGALSTWLLAR